MTVRDDLCIVSPQEARQWLEEGSSLLVAHLAHTVATEPNRTRAAVVEALQDLAKTNFYDGDTGRPCGGYYDLIDRAIAIENGAPL